MTLVLLLSGMGTFCFVAIMNILGWAEEGPRWSASLSVYTVFLAMASIGLFLMRIDKYRFSRTSMAYCGAIVVMCLGFMITSQYAQDASRYFFLFVSTAIPGFLAGLLLCDQRLLRHAWKYVDILMLLFTVSLAMYQLSASHPEGYTVDYQTASYMGAFSFGLNLCLLMRLGNVERFKFFGARGWRLCSIALLGLQAVLTLLTGGRGGVLLLALFALIAFVLLVKRGMGIKKLFFIGLAAAAALFVANFVMENQNLEGIARILSGRDNRSNVYDLAWLAFQKNPIVGYGPYGYLDAMEGIEYPHNIFLELLLTYGIVGVAFEIGLAMILCIRVKRTGSSGIPTWLAVVAIYSIVRLFFSSTLLSFSPFWFVLGFFCNYSSASRGTSAEDSPTKKVSDKDCYSVGRCASEHPCSY